MNLFIVVQIILINSSVIIPSIVESNDFGELSENQILWIANIAIVRGLKLSCYILVGYIFFHFLNLFYYGCI